MKNIFIFLLLVVSATSFAQGRALTFRNESNVEVKISALDTNYYIGPLDMSYYQFYDEIKIPPGRSLIFAQFNDVVSYPFCCVSGCDLMPTNIWTNAYAVGTTNAVYLACNVVPQYTASFLHLRVFKYFYTMSGTEYGSFFMTHDSNQQMISAGPSGNQIGAGSLTITQTILDDEAIYNQVITFR
ncbi:hypothetical protein [Myroides odoratus]|uniref:hypothetical protein n=1 Tax=Myroides odoratus TaxID=256 RepID=UPI003340ECB7